ncbi:MAG: translation elongation factor Ts [Chloroflexota bacterium]|nr:MAG: translation elongation factor Ts [Chloroflexota bacterium]
MAQPVSTEAIKDLREKTGAGVMECKRALTEAGGDFKKAEEFLRQRGLAVAEKRAERLASQGVIDAYIHAGGRIGVLVELNCETDFVARTDDFRALAHDLAMQIAATDPKYISTEDVPAGEEVNPEQDCLLSQPSIRYSNLTVLDLIHQTITKTGEAIRVRRFVRYELGR